MIGSSGLLRMVNYYDFLGRVKDLKAYWCAMEIWMQLIMTKWATLDSMRNVDTEALIKILGRGD